MVEYYRANRPEGVTILSVLWLVEAFVHLLIGLGLALGGAFAALSDLVVVTGPVTEIVGAFGGGFIIAAIIYFVIGWGLWNLRSWARTAAIVFAIIGLLNFPVGTIISLVVLWYLFQDEVKLAFEEGAVARETAT